MSECKIFLSLSDSNTEENSEFLLFERRFQKKMRQSSFIVMVQLWMRIYMILFKLHRISSTNTFCSSKFVIQTIFKIIKRRGPSNTTHWQHSFSDLATLTPREFCLYEYMKKCYWDPAALFETGLPASPCQGSVSR